MSLNLKERKVTDPLEVRALFALHRSFGQNGRFWIKNMTSQRHGGEVYRSLIGAVHSIANQKEFRRKHMKEILFSLLYSALPRHYRNAHVLSYAGACQDFNDRRTTEWADLEIVIRRAIEIGRTRDADA